jgi:YgiT-type zinc finger domain-containing protein
LNCAVCRKGETKPGKSVFRLANGNQVFVLKNIPSNICRDCGEEYIDEEITKLVLQNAHDSFEKNLGSDLRDWDNLY